MDYIRNMKSSTFETDTPQSNFPYRPLELNSWVEPY